MLGEKIDTLYALRQQRLALEREAEELKRQEKDLEGDLLMEVSNIGLTAAKGNKASFSVSKDVVPNVNVWEDLYSFIVEEKDFTLLQKRIGVTAWKEYREDGLIVPGTEAFEIAKVSLRKL